MNNDSEDYLQTISLMEAVLNKESPDLIVLTGDVVDPKATDDDYSYHFSSAMELIKSREIPYVWTGGNPIEGKTNYDLHEIDYSIGHSLSFTGYVWDQHVIHKKTKNYD